MEEELDENGYQKVYELIGYPGTYKNSKVIRIEHF
jgi:hypothetical protein